MKIKTLYNHLLCRLSDLAHQAKEISGPLALLMIVFGTPFSGSEKDDLELPKNPLPAKVNVTIKQAFTCNTDNRYAEIWELTRDEKIFSSLVLGDIGKTSYKGINTHTSSEYKKMAELFCNTGIVPDVRYENLSAKGDFYVCTSLNGQIIAQSNIQPKRSNADEDIGKLMVFKRKDPVVTTIDPSKIQEITRDVCIKPLTL